MTSDRTERLAEAFPCTSEIGFAVLDRELRYQALNHCLTHIGILVVEVTQRRKLQRLLRELAGELRGLKGEDGSWYGRKIHDCIDQYDAALEASFDVLVRNPATSQFALSMPWIKDCASCDDWFLRYHFRYLSMPHFRRPRNSRQRRPLYAHNAGQKLPQVTEF